MICDLKSWVFLWEKLTVGRIEIMKLKKEAFERACYFVKATARSLDQALFEYYFNNGDAQAILVELASYQNEDGGFGKWLRSDFALSASSPSATVEAFHYMEKVKILYRTMLIRCMKFSAIQQSVRFCLIIFVPNVWNNDLELEE